jgi:uncharacterized membrane protein YsdA (DUF1294 family)
MAKRMRPELYHSGLALLLILLGTVGLMLLFRQPFLSTRWYYWLATYLLAANVVTFGYFGYDKGKAGAGGRRVPELVLFGLAFIGGTLGAYAAMCFFRHKSIKGPFRLVFWFIVVVQIGLIAGVSYRIWKVERRTAGLVPTVQTAAR